MTSNFALKHVKSGNKKSLKGQEVYNSNVCVDPATDIVSPVVTQYDYKTHIQLLRFAVLMEEEFLFGLHTRRNKRLEHVLVRYRGRYHGQLSLPLRRVGT